MKKTLDVVIPVLNEERALADSVHTLAAFLSDNLNDYDWAIVVADNGSTDATPSICQSLSEQDSRIRHVRLEQRGRGRALKRAWAESDADIVFVPMTAALRERSREGLFLDDVHPTRLGHALLSESLLPVLRRAIEAR